MVLVRPVPDVLVSVERQILGTLLPCMRPARNSDGEFLMITSRQKDLLAEIAAVGPLMILDRSDWGHRASVLEDKLMVTSEATDRKGVARVSVTHAGRSYLAQG